MIQIINQQMTFNDVSFQPEVEVTFRIPLELVSDDTAILGEAEFAVKLGTALIKELNKLKEAV